MGLRRIAFALLIGGSEALMMVAVLGGPIILLLAWFDLSLAAAAIVAIAPAAATFCVCFFLAAGADDSGSRRVLARLMDANFWLLLASWPALFITGGSVAVLYRFKTRELAGFSGSAVGLGAGLLLWGLMMAAGAFALPSLWRRWMASRRRD